MPVRIPQDVIDRFAAQTFASASDINSFFNDLVGARYIVWFNANLAGRGPWAAIRLDSSAGNLERFDTFWDLIPVVFKDSLVDSTITAIQFTALMSIISNETSGRFTPITELIGTTGHPGLAYPFDAIPNLKRSYNKNPGLGNKTAFECFNNPDYIDAFGTLPASSLANTNDPVWKGDVYPQATVSTSSAPSRNGFIIEADFMKFRGRGLIQTTGRDNYRRIIRFVQNYTGDNGVIQEFKSNWEDLTEDQAAFVSSNADWDRLFQETDLEIASASIQQHNRVAGNYFDLSSDEATLNGSAAGSVQFMGKKISGSNTYAATFFERTAMVLNTLDRAEIVTFPPRRLVTARRARASGRG